MVGTVVLEAVTSRLAMRRRQGTPVQLEALRSIEMTHRGSNDAQEGIAAVSIVVNEAMFDTAFSVPLRRRGVVADAPR